MRLPRRVPWSTISELEQVCDWIYNDEYDVEVKIHAVNRLSAWRAITLLPHALESTLSLLVVNIEDQQRASRPGSVSTLSLRQNYATALVRLVNGLVDPLQQGVYARSIASIAQQIGLPQWSVELRHAATHEELPSLELLRSGSNEALRWLLHNYFLPTLAGPSSTVDAIKACNVAPLQLLLKKYKTVMKTLSRDVSLVPQFKGEVTQILQEVENWIVNTRLAASAAIFRGWGTETNSSRGDHASEDWRERWALERLCDALLDRGGLVPVSSKKRTTSRDSSLPEVLKDIWKNLLLSVHANHPLFPSILLSRILDSLLQRADNTRLENNDPVDRSWDLCLAGWALFVIEEWEDDDESNLTPGEDVDELDAPVTSSIRRRDVVISLVTALGSGETGTDCVGANFLLENLASGDGELENISSLLQPIAAARRSQRPVLGAPEEEKLMDIMDDRLMNVLSITKPGQKVTTQQLASPLGITSEEVDPLPRGWSKVPAHSWRPCPIGIFAR